MNLPRFLLSLAAFGLVAVGVNAAANSNDEVVHLPVYRIEVPRHSDAEKAIAISLKAVADQASLPIAVRPEIPLFAKVQEAPSALPAPVRVARI